MRVHVLGQLPPPQHGSALSAQLLVKALTDAGHDVSVTSRDFSQTAAEVGKASWRKLLRWPILLLKFAQVLRAVRPDVVVFYTTNRPASFLVDVSLLWIAARCSGASAFVGYVHTVGFQRLGARNRVWKWMVRRHLDSYNCLVTLGDSIVVDIAQLTATEVRVIKNAILEPVTFARAAHSAPTIGMLSNLTVAKGSLEFIHIAEETGITALLAGPVADEEVRKRLDESRPPNLQYLGSLDGAEKEKFFSSVEIFVFPSQYAFEAQPFVLIEAMAYECAVVSYDVGGVQDLLSKPLSGVLVPLGDLQNMMEAVQLVASDRTLRVELQTQARTQFVRNHSFAAYAESWTNLLADVTSSHRES